MKHRPCCLPFVSLKAEHPLPGGTVLNLWMTQVPILGSESLGRTLNQVSVKCWQKFQPEKLGECGFVYNLIRFWVYSLFFYLVSFPQLSIFYFFNLFALVSERLFVCRLTGSANKAHQSLNKTKTAC